MWRENCRSETAEANKFRIRKCPPQKSPDPITGPNHMICASTLHAEITPPPRMFSVCCTRRSKEHKIVAQATGATSPRHSTHLPRYRLRQPGIPTDAHRYTHAVVCNGKKRAKRDGRQAATGRKHPRQPGENTHAHIRLKRVGELPPRPCSTQAGSSPTTWPPRPSAPGL